MTWLGEPKEHEVVFFQARPHSLPIVTLLGVASGAGRAYSVTVSVLHHLMPRHVNNNPTILGLILWNIDPISVCIRRLRAGVCVGNGR